MFLATWSSEPYLVDSDKKADSFDQWQSRTTIGKLPPEKEPLSSLRVPGEIRIRAPRL
jgi:hypothetical protein